MHLTRFDWLKNNQLLSELTHAHYWEPVPLNDNSLLFKFLKDFDYFKISFRCTKLIKWQRLRQRLRARLASKSRAKTANSECRSLLHTLSFSSLVPFQFSIYCVHLPLKANFKPVLFCIILLNCVCFYASL